MLDEILGVAASMDWITPLAPFVQDLANGPSHTFLIPYASSPLSGREVGWMLGKRGVRCWGLMVVSGTLMVSVRLNQARYAEHLLGQHGVPLENALPQQAAQRRRAGAQSVAQRSRILRALNRR